MAVEKHSTKSGSSARAVFQKTDVTDWAQLERMFEVAEREFGEIDIVCPGAGVYEPVDEPPHLFTRAFSDNFFLLALFKLLVPSRFAGVSRFTGWITIRVPGHQPNPSNPNNPTRHFPFPRLPETQVHCPHFQHRRPKPHARSTYLCRNEARYQRPRPIAGSIGEGSWCPGYGSSSWSYQDTALD